MAETDLEQTGTIYIHSNKVNGKVYVGQTWNYKNRTKEKVWGYRGNRHFSSALAKYGWEGFDHQIVVENIATQDELDNLEQLWVIVLQAIDHSYGYNFLRGGSRGRHTAESKKAISESLKRVSCKTRFKKGQVTRGYTGHKANSGSFKPGQFVGIPLSPEHRKKIAAKKKAWWDRQKGISCQT